MCLFLSFIYKTLGEYSWTWTSQVLPGGECSADTDALTIAAITTANPLDGLLTEQEAEEDASLIQVAQNFHLSLQNLKQVFTPEVYRGIFGFATWWSCFVWFASSSLGMFYQTYFTNKT